MNGMHDLGGMDGFGPIHIEHNEPVFHSAWEKTMFGIACTIPFSVPFGDDHLRREIERIEPQTYLNSSYYELWFRSISSILEERGVLNPNELNCVTENRIPKNLSSEAVRAEQVKEMIWAGASTRMESAEIRQNISVGDQVIVSENAPYHHTRVPRYARGKHGVVILDHGIFTFPDTNSEDLGERAQHCYTVEFDGRELWGKNAETGTSVTLDLWEEYIKKI